MFRESILMAWSSLISNKLRTILTMLGIIIGVAAVIALVSIGYGVRHKIETNLSTLGSNLLIVYPSPSHKKGVRATMDIKQRITVKDFEAISHIPTVNAASPVMRKEYTAVYKNNNWNTVVTGVNSAYLTVRNRSVEEGRSIDSEQVIRRARVALIGPKVAEKLFYGENPLGKDIRIGNQPFTIIGVLDKKGTNAMGADEDDVILVPYTTFMERMTGQTFISIVYVTGKDPNHLTSLEDDIQNTLRLRHRTPQGENDFAIDNLASIMKKVAETTATLTLFLGAIATISLIVGGIGIMNIMLVSVTERTREIGIRKALGATYQTIVTQFLIEAVFISLCGGCIGVVFGILISKVIALAIHMETIISLPTIILAFGFSMAIGLIFGIYPARKAARLNPIDALHYE